MPPAKPPKRPVIDTRRIAGAAGSILRTLATRLVTAALSPDLPQALPQTNRLTDVEITLTGIEEASTEYLAEALQRLWPPGVLRGQPKVVVMQTGRPGHHLVFLQFVITLECNAAQAMADCESTLSAMTDGVSVLGWDVRVVGTR